MSQQYRQIQDGEFRVVINAREIQREVFRIISNEKYVPKRMRWLGADIVAKVAKEFKYEVKLANNCRRYIQDQERYTHQLAAISLLKTLSQLMDDLSDDIGFSHDKIKQFQAMVNTELNLLSKWISSER